MIQLDSDALNALIGWAAAPLLLIAVVSHIKGFISVIPWTKRDATSPDAWAPLALDGLGVGYVKLMQLDGRLVLDGGAGWPTVGLLGVALGVIAGKAYDLWTSRGS